MQVLSASLPAISGPRLCSSLFPGAAAAPSRILGLEANLNLSPLPTPTVSLLPTVSPLHPPPPSCLPSWQMINRYLDGKAQLLYPEPHDVFPCDLIHSDGCAVPDDFTTQRIDQQ